MKRLDTVIKTNGSEYQILRRSENVALYKQFIGGTHVAYELFEIKTRPEETIKGVKYPSREVFATNEQFGASAFSLRAVLGDETAINRFEKYNKEIVLERSKNK